MGQPMELAALCCSLTWLAVVALLIVRATRQRGQLPRLVAGAPISAGAVPSIAVLVPARDEAANIEPCLHALLTQDYPARHYRIVVIDDQSTDGTADLVEALARHHPRLRLLRSPQLPTGWTGKSHACWLGAQSIGPGADWLCFVDADMRAAPSLLTGAVRSAQVEKLDLLSVAPRQVLTSFAERLVIPCGLFVLAFTRDLGALQAPDGRDVTATGQFMLIRAETYWAIGGHAAVRTAICEDLELARACKRADGRVLLMDGAAALSGRMYSGWRTLWPGFAKNAVDMLGGSFAAAATALASIVLSWAAVLVPAFAGVAYTYHPSTMGLLALACAAVATVAIFAIHLAGAVHFRIPVWYGLLFPLGYTTGALIAADSIRRRRRAGVTWKGRIYS